MDAGPIDGGAGRCNGSGLSRSALAEDLRVDAMDMSDAMAICEWGRRLGGGRCGDILIRVMPSCETDLLFTGSVPCTVTACEVEACIFDQLTMTLPAGMCDYPRCTDWIDCGDRAVAAAP